MSSSATETYGLNRSPTLAAFQHKPANVRKCDRKFSTRTDSNLGKACLLRTVVRVKFSTSKFADPKKSACAEQRRKKRTSSDMGRVAIEICILNPRNEKHWTLEAPVDHLIAYILPVCIHCRWASEFPALNIVTKRKIHSIGGCLCTNRSFNAEIPR